MRHPPTPAANRRGRARRPTLSLLALAIGAGLLAPATSAQDPSDEPAIIARIVELQREIDRLVAELSPGAVKELRRRLAAGGSPSPTPAEPKAPATATPAVTAPAAPPPAAPSGRTSACSPLALFDSNADGLLTAADRHWRHFYLWRDGDGDGGLAEAELAHLFERDVDQLALSLERFKTRRGDVGDVRVGQLIELELIGKSKRVERYALVIEASGLARGGELALLAPPDGELLAGYQPLRRGLAVRTADGQVSALDCPSSPW